MPTQEVVFAARPAALLQRCAGAGRVLLDGGGARSWSEGAVRLADRPRATLEVFASAWGRWRWGGACSWRRADPLAQWEDFQRRAWCELGAGPHVGLVSVFAYDLKHWMERLPRRLSWPAQPLLYAAVYDWRYEADRRRGRAFLHAATAEALDERRRWFEEAIAAGEGENDFACGELRAAMGSEEHARMLRRAQEYIAAGDIYQVNLARSFHAAFPAAASAALFARWTEAFPMPFAAFVDAGDWALVSNSPECFLRIDGDRIATFPIKGTRRFEGEDGAAAASAARQLAADAKERAEHVMIVDLERNDLGRVCVPGSVAVRDFMAVERFPLLQHMVSEVRGVLLPEMSPARILRATFPGGSITGAPKVRAMQIIEELEPLARGFYTGALGWSTPDGSARFSIAIRTALVDRRGLHFHAGGGIVTDSSAEREFEETETKADALRRVLAGRVIR